jgi:hypothetical protein
LQVGERIVKAVGGIGLFGFGHPASHGNRAQTKTTFYIGKTNPGTGPVVRATSVEVAVKQSALGWAMDEASPAGLGETQMHFNRW